MSDETEAVVEQTADIDKGDDPEAYNAAIQKQREEDAERDHDAENIARARQGRLSLEDEEKEAEEARKNAEAQAKKNEAEAKKAEKADS